ncbi:MAG: uroporphyrinogen-III C-methyltransferase, partial [Chloroflexota bacterium]
MSSRAGAGTVYLVGGGPGDPGLLTLRGQELLARANVVVYDYLVDPGLLAFAAQAEHIYVGDAHDRHRVRQDEINARLIDLARAGSLVVRLKGGDPFLFGRGGEEAQALHAAGIPFEVVPGVSSALAVPAYAGIPVTHRDLASSVSIITGVQAAGANAGDWADLAAKPGTLVFLMGMSRLGAIVAELLAHGRAGDTPAAAIRWGTRPDQQTVTGSLRDLPRLTDEAGLRAPAVVVVGEVVRLRDELRWFETRPLFGLGVLVTRAAEQAGPFAGELRQLGARVYELPVIAVEPVDGPGPAAALEHLPEYDWVIFTSTNAVRTLWTRLRASGRDARAFASARLCAIGPATAAALETLGLVPDVVPHEHVAEGVLAALQEQPLRKVLLPCAAGARDVLPRGLRERGVEVDVVSFYRTVPAAASAA